MENLGITGLYSHFDVVLELWMSKHIDLHVYICLCSQHIDRVDSHLLIERAHSGREE